MPDRVLPEPVSPVMSQPRQKSSRVHEKPFNLTIYLPLMILTFVVVAYVPQTAKTVAMTHENGDGNFNNAAKAVTNDRQTVVYLISRIIKAGIFRPQFRLGARQLPRI